MALYHFVTISYFPPFPVVPTNDVPIFTCVPRGAVPTCGSVMISDVPPLPNGPRMEASVRAPRSIVPALASVSTAEHNKRSLAK